MATQVDICNMAISHLGSAKTITDFNSDMTQEAKACRSFYEHARDSVLADFAWPFAKKVAELELVEEEPNALWGYSYRYPADCLMMRRIASEIVTETRQSRITFNLSSDASGQLIYTNEPTASIEYTKRAEDVAYYPPGFVMALSLRLAAFICPRIAGNQELGNRAYQLYQLEITRAQVTAANEEQPAEEPESEFIRIRG